MADKIKGITISIGADTQPLQKALKSINTSSRRLTNELKAIDKLLKFEPKNTELLSQKQKVLAQNIENTKNKLEVLTQSQEKVTSLYKKGEIDEGAYRKFQREIQATEINLKRMQEQAAKNNSELKAATSSINSATISTGAFSKAKEKLNSIFDKTKEKIVTLNEKVKTYAANLDRKMTLVSGTIVGAGGIAYKAFENFDKGMREVFTLLGEDVPTEFTDSLSQRVKEFSKEFRVVPEEVVPALYQALSASVPTDNVFDFLTTAVKLQKGGVTDLTTAVDLLSSVVNAYGAENLNAEKAADILFTTVKAGKTTISELAGSIGKIAPIANMVGVPLEDISAALAGITSQGSSTSEATTQLVAALKAFASPTDEMAKALEKVASAMVKEGKISGELVDKYKKQVKVLETLKKKKAALNTETKEGKKQAAEFTKAIDKQKAEVYRAIKGLGSLILESEGVAGAFELVKNQAEGNSDTLTKMLGSVEGLGAVSKLTSETGLTQFKNTLDSMKNSVGAADEAYNKMTSGVSTHTEDIQTKLSNLKIEIGEKLAPVVSDLLEKFSGFLDFLSNNSPEVIRFAGVILGLTLALKGLLFIDKIIKLFKSWRIATIAANTAMLIFKGTVLLFNTVAKITNSIMSKGPWGLILSLAGAALPFIISAFMGGNRETDSIARFSGNVSRIMRSSTDTGYDRNNRYLNAQSSKTNMTKNTYTVNINNKFGDRYSERDTKKILNQIDKELGRRLK